MANVCQRAKVRQNTTKSKSKRSRPRNGSVLFFFGFCISIKKGEAENRLPFLAQRFVLTYFISKLPQQVQSLHPPVTLISRSVHSLQSLLCLQFATSQRTPQLVQQHPFILFTSLGQKFPSAWQIYIYQKAFLPVYFIGLFAFPR